MMRFCDVVDGWIAGELTSAIAKCQLPGEPATSRSRPSAAVRVRQLSRHWRAAAIRHSGSSSAVVHLTQGVTCNSEKTIAFFALPSASSRCCGQISTAAGITVPAGASSRKMHQV